MGRTKSISDDMRSGSLHTMKTGNKLRIVKYNSAIDVDVEFVETGYKTKSQASHIRRGSVVDKLRRSVYSVGYVGCGGFKSSLNGKNSPSYNAWSNMLMRCYDNKYQEKKPTYKGCTVCKEWHNFQNFAKWYEENYPKDGGVYHLDKDIKVIGNKIYSPETCMFVTPAENTTIALEKEYVLVNPNGCIVKIKNMAEFCRENNIGRSGMSMLVIRKIESYKGWRVA